MFVRVQSPNPGLYRGPPYIPLPTAARFTTGGSETGRSGVRGCKARADARMGVGGGEGAGVQAPVRRGACVGVGLGLEWLLLFL